jgi:hypothetical protein
MTSPSPENDHPIFFRQRVTPCDEKATVPGKVQRLHMATFPLADEASLPSHVSAGIKAQDPTRQRSTAEGQ